MMSCGLMFWGCAGLSWLLPSSQLVWASNHAGESTANKTTPAQRLSVLCIVNVLRVLKTLDADCGLELLIRVLPSRALARRSKSVLDWLALLGGKMRNCVRTAIVFTNILLASALFVPLSAQTASTAKRPFTFEDMMTLKRIGGAALPPYGT